MISVEFTVREPKTTWINRIIFSTIFSGIITLMVYLIRRNILENLTTVDLIYIILHLISFLLIIFSFLFSIVVRDYIHFNFSKNKMRYSYSFGNFKYNKKWQDLVDLKYISVFNTENGYEVNLWKKKKEILNLFMLNESNEAFKNALFFADKLNIDLVDARKRGNHRRINIITYKKTGEIVYSK